MDVNEVSIGLQSIIGLGAGLLSALGVWYKLKHKVDIKEQMIKQLQKEVDNAHIRITDLKKENRKLYEEFHQFERDFYKNK